MARVSKRAILLAAAALPYLLQTFTGPEHLWNGSKWQTSRVAFLVMMLMWFTWTCILYPLYFSPLRQLPQPKQDNLLLGQFVRVLKEPTGTGHREWMRDIPNNGLIYYRSILNSERVLVTNPKGLGEALTTKSYDLIKPPALLGGLARVVGEKGILVVEGQEHKVQRKNLMPAFAYRHVKDLYPVFWDKSRDMILEMDKFLRERSAADDKPIQDQVIRVDGWTSRGTLDIIGLAGIGKSFNAIDDENSKLYQAYQTIFLQDWQARLIGLLNIFLPFWLLRIIPIPRNLEVEKARLFIRNTCLDLIAEKRARIADAKEKGESDATVGGIDILTVALKSGAFTDNEIVDQLMTFLAAGHETTATAMTWAVLFLCQHPEIQKRLRDELRTSHLPDIRDTHGQITAEQTDQIPYLHAVVNEVLRYYSPVPLTLREAGVDTVLCGQLIPKGTMVVTAPIATNRDVTLWGSDADTFNPDRWLGAGKSNTGGAESNYANMTFSHGPRSCIGSAFAKAEFACLLAAWVLGFESTLADPDKKIEVTGGIIARIKGGLDVKLTPLGPS